MPFRDRLRGRILDFVMKGMNDLRADVLAASSGEVLEVGFGTALNVRYYPEGVTTLTGLDPQVPLELPNVAKRVNSAPFPVECVALPADNTLPFDDNRFDCVVTTWTLCSIPDPARALAEMRRVLKPGGKYLFIEHGRASVESTARWQDRLNGIWGHIADGCNINRQIDRIVEDAGFALNDMQRFKHDGPNILTHMYQGIASPAA